MPGYEQYKPFMGHEFFGPNDLRNAVESSLEHLAGVTYRELYKEKSKGFKEYGYSQAQLDIIDRLIDKPLHSKAPELTPGRSDSLTRLSYKIAHLNPDANVATASLPIKKASLNNLLYSPLKIDRGETSGDEKAFSLPLLVIYVTDLTINNWGINTPELNGSLSQSIFYMIKYMRGYDYELTYVPDAKLTLDDVSQETVNKRISNLNGGKRISSNVFSETGGRAGKVRSAGSADAQFGSGGGDANGDHPAGNI